MNAIVRTLVSSIAMAAGLQIGTQAGAELYANRRVIAAKAKNKITSINIKKR